MEEYHLSHNIPYRFTPIIDKYVQGSCVGIFLLNNGDILIAKNRAVRLIKRNLKWLNLSYNLFHDIVTSKVLDMGVHEDLIKQIYASVLDVSFAHTGGIIAVVSDIAELMKETSAVLNICDNLVDERSLCAMYKELQKKEAGRNLSPTECGKRVLKRKAIQGLVGKRKFSELDRKLRTELIAMDGACILSFAGDVYGVGAIIRNDSGSSGGGRSSAAKKLSTFGGFSVKISTDGYIELFVGFEPVYAIK